MAQAPAFHVSFPDLPHSAPFWLHAILYTHQGNELYSATIQRWIDQTEKFVSDESRWELEQERARMAFRLLMVTAPGGWMEWMLNYEAVIASAPGLNTNTTTFHHTKCMCVLVSTQTHVQAPSHPHPHIHIYTSHVWACAWHAVSS